MSKAKIKYGAFLALFCFASCWKQKMPSSKQETGTKYGTYNGVLNVSADIGLESVIRQQNEVFEFIHDSVHVNLAYESEKEMLDNFRKKKSTVILLSRALEQVEIDDFRNNDAIYVKQVPIAYDAVALIGNKEFDDSKLDIPMLKTYFDGAKSLLAAPSLIFDNQNSSVVSFVLNLLGYKGKISTHAFAVKSVEEVIDYTSKNKDAIGFIPYNSVSDTDDERVKAVLKRIKILSLRAKNERGELVRVSANQSDIVTGDYPLIRKINAVARLTYEDNLESLFVTFLYKERGAKIFLKAGLIPAKMPERDIIVNESEVTGSR